MISAPVKARKDTFRYSALGILLALGLKSNDASATSCVLRNPRFTADQPGPTEHNCDGLPCELEVSSTSDGVALGLAGYVDDNHFHAVLEPLSTARVPMPTPPPSGLLLVALAACRPDLDCGKIVLVPMEYGITSISDEFSFLADGTIQVEESHLTIRWVDGAGAVVDATYTLIE